MKNVFIIPAVLFFLWMIMPVPAQEAASGSSGMDDLLGGFDSEGPMEIVTEEDEAEGEVNTAVSNSGEDAFSTEEGISFQAAGSSPFLLGGEISLRTGCNYAFAEDESVPFDRRGLSDITAGLYLHARADLGENWFAEVSGKACTDFSYLMDGRDYTDVQFETERQSAVLHEAFICGYPFPGWEVRAGRQIFSFGKADQIQILDRLNPLDLREPGLQEMRDLKLPVGSVKLAWNSPAGISVTAVAVPELRKAEIPVYGSEFYPGGLSGAGDTWPETGADHNEYLISADIFLPSLDLTLLYSYLLQDTPRAVVSLDGVTLVYDRLHTLGAAAEAVLGSFVLTAEGAYLRGFGFQGDPGTDYARIDILGGLAWRAPLELDTAVELCFRHYPDLDESILTPAEYTQKSTWEGAFRISRRFFHERMQIGLVSKILGLEGDNGGIIRFDCEWEISDGFKTKLTWADYLDAEKGMLAGAGDNDRLVLSVSRSF